MMTAPLLAALLAALLASLSTPASAALFGQARGGGAAGAPKALPTVVVDAIKGQLSSMENAGRASLTPAQMLYRAVAPIEPGRIQAAPESVAAAMLLRDALVDEGRFGSLSAGLGEEHHGLSARIAGMRAALAASPAARAELVERFKPVDAALAAKQPLAKLGAVLGSFYDGGVLNEDALDRAVPGGGFASAWDAPRGPGRKPKIRLALQPAGLTEAEARPIEPGAWLKGAKPGEVLFVCTGNTCRSPAAESMFNDLAERKGQTEVRAVSRGSYASSGPRADGHVPTSLAEADIFRARVILALDEANAEGLVRRFPQAYGKTTTIKRYAGMGEGDIPDPYGAGIGIYWKTISQIFTAVENIWEKIAPGPASAPKTPASAGAAQVAADLAPSLPLSTVFVRFRDSAMPNPDGYAKALAALPGRFGDGLGREGLIAKTRERWESEIHFAFPMDAAAGAEALAKNPDVAAVSVHPRLAEAVKAVEGPFPDSLGYDDVSGSVRVLFADGTSEEQARALLAETLAKNVKVLRDGKGRLQGFVNMPSTISLARGLVLLRRGAGIAKIAASPMANAVADRTIYTEDGLSPVFPTLYDDEKGGLQLRAINRKGVNPPEVAVRLGDPHAFLAKLHELRRDGRVAYVEVTAPIAEQLVKILTPRP